MLNSGFKRLKRKSPIMDTYRVFLIILDWRVGGNKEIIFFLKSYAFNLVLFFHDCLQSFWTHAVFELHTWLFSVVLHFL